MSYPLIDPTAVPLADGPHARLERLGPSALTNDEVLTLLLSGSAGENVAREQAAQLLAQFGGLHGIGRLSVDEFAALHGVGPARATQLVAAFELGRRIAAQGPILRQHIRTPADVAQLLIVEMSGLVQEHLRVILLDCKNRLIGIETVYIGTVNSSAIRVGEILRPAIRRNAPAMILCHNHPTGELTPSPDDVKVTTNVVQAGDLVDITILDHLIVGGGAWLSMREKRLGFAT